MTPGPKNLITDVSGFKVGNAQDETLKSGTTVLTADQSFTAAVHIMGAAPGTRETDLLAPDRTVQKADALFLSGGSGFGLSAGSGIADALRQAGRGFKIGSVCVPIAPGAILFDLLNGGDKNWNENPYWALGQVALSNAASTFSLGSFGAGTGATTATLKGGLGSASIVLDSGITIGALVSVNALGSVTFGNTKQFRAAPYEMNSEFGGLGTPHQYDPCDFQMKPVTEPGQNTTIAIIATDADVTKSQLTRVCTAAHDGMARAIFPSHTPLDGDAVFGAASNTHKLNAPVNDMIEICHAAAMTLSRAIARGVFAAQATPGDLLPCWSEIESKLME